MVEPKEDGVGTKFRIMLPVNGELRNGKMAAPQRVWKESQNNDWPEGQFALAL